MANPLADRANNTNEFGRAQLKAAKGNFDPQLSSSIESKQFNSSNYFTFGNAELKQAIYSSHALKLGYQYGQGINLNPERKTTNVGLPYLGAEISILQGMLFDKRRAELLKAKHYTDYFSAEQKMQLNDLLFAASNSYLEFQYAKKVIGLYSYFAKLADQRLKGVSELAAVGEKPAIDTIEASIFLQGRRLDQQAGEIELLKRLNEMNSFFFISTTTPQTAFQTRDSLDQIYQMILTSMQRQLLNEESKNPIIAQYEAKQRVLETEQRLQKELIKPILNLNYNFLSPANDQYFNNLSTNNYKWGATFAFPLYLRKPRNEYKMASLLAKNNKLETINKQNQINFKRKYIVEAIRITTAQIQQAEKSALFSKMLVEAERLKFNNGESSLFLLNTRESKWLESELKLADCKFKLIKNFLELTYVNGDLSYVLN